MHLREGILEVANAHLVIRGAADLLGPVVDGVELAELVLETDVLEDHLNLVTSTRFLELLLVHANLVEVGREEQVDRLGLVTKVLVVGDTSECFVRDVIADGWQAKAAVLVLLMPHNVAGAWLAGATKVEVGLELSLARLTVDAVAGVPDVSAREVLDAMDEVRTAVNLTLAQILRLAEQVAGDGLVVLDRLLHDHRLRVHLFGTLCVEGHGGTVGDLLLGVTENMIVRVELPLIVAVLLFARCIVHVGLAVECIACGVVLSSTPRCDHLLGGFKALRLLSEGDRSSLAFFGPLIIARERHAERLLDVGRILGLLDVVELVGETGERLGLDDVADVLGGVGGFAIAVALREAWRIVGHSVVLLNFPRLIHVGLTELLEVLGRGGLIRRQVDILSDAVVGILLHADAGIAMTGGVDSRNRVSTHLN